MKKTNLVLATVLASIVGFGSTAAIAQSDGSGERSWKHSGEHMMKRMAHKLNLTDDQKAQMKTMRDSQKADNQGLREQMKQLRQDMQNLDSNDATAVAALATRKSELSQQRFTAQTQSRLAFESILNAEQKLQLTEMKAERQAKRAARMQKRQERKAARDNAS